MTVKSAKEDHYNDNFDIEIDEESRITNSEELEKFWECT
jgi:hypothetical protein